ncbi:MAG TPA: hypothetical protein VF131_16130 [Blastocatellia bacterium]|nr:hypothetical protein [Blastocatellia bacterium]
MRKVISLKSIGAIVAAIALALSLSQGAALAQGGKKDKSKKEEKKLDKEARKLENAAEKTGRELGRDVVFCILAAHTDVGTAQELKDKFNSLTDFPFGQFVAAVLLADRLDDPGFSLDVILQKLSEGMSLGQIIKEAKESMSEIRKGFGQFRSELARAMTNPPTRDCFNAGS